MVATLIMIISFTLLVMETLIGMVANGFIVLVNFFNWFRSRKLSPNDLILSCLGLSRLVWQAVLLLDQTFLFFPLDKHSWNYINLMVSIVWIFAHNITIWFSTWLSVFYLAKIAIFSHPIFLQVKQRISGLVPWLLVGSVVFSAVMAIILVTSLGNGLSTCPFYTSHLSNNDSEIEIPDYCRYFDSLATAPALIPLMIFLSSSILLIISLWKHTRRIQHNGTYIKDLNTQIHLAAIKVLASFSVLYVSSFVAIASQAILVWNNMGHHWLPMLLGDLVAAYPSGHAIILILINPKLKQAWVGMLYHLKCCLSKASS